MLNLKQTYKEKSKP